MNATDEEIAAYAPYAALELERRRELLARCHTPYPLAILRFLAGWDMVFMPTMREVGEACGIKSRSSVLYWYRALREAGLISYENNLTRTVRLTSLGRAVEKYDADRT